MWQLSNLGYSYLAYVGVWQNILSLNFHEFYEHWYYKNQNLYFILHCIKNKIQLVWRENFPVNYTKLLYKQVCLQDIMLIIESFRFFIYNRCIFEGFIQKASELHILNRFRVVDNPRSVSMFLRPAILFKLIKYFLMKSWIKYKHRNWLN